MTPLLEFASTGDDVFELEDAFQPEHINKSLGRLYRSWVKMRKAMDPDFDSERYRHSRKTVKMRKVTPKPRSR